MPHNFRSCVDQAWKWCKPRFEDKSLELRYVAERRARVLPMLKVMSAVYLFIWVFWWLLPHEDMAFEVWLFFRINSGISTIGCAISTLFLLQRQEAWRHYDFVATFWGCHFLVFQAFSRTSTETLLGLETNTPGHDEGLQVLCCIGWIIGFLCFAEVNLLYLLWLVHFGPLVWVLNGVWLGVSTSTEMFIKLSLVYYLISMLTLFQAIRSERACRQMLQMQVSLERQAQMERSLVQAERTAIVNKAFAVEQQALRAFMAAVFDIMGQLEWRTIEADSEPTLCFIDEPNPALDSLLKTSTSGMPLEVVLGPPPDPRGPGRDKYTKERQRLCSYAYMEATRPREDAGESTGHCSTRKISITCADSSGQQFEAELFIGPGGSDRALFGMLLLNAGQHDFAARHEPKDRFPNFAQIGCDSSSSDWTNPVSSNTSSEGALLMLESAEAQKGDFAVWVDASNPQLPILKCTVAFTCLSGPSSSGAYFIDWVEEREAFYRWVQLQMNQLSCESANSRDDSPFSLRLHPPGAAGKTLQFRASCYLEVGPSEGSQGVDESTSNEMMAKLCLHNVTHCRRRKNRIGGGRQLTRSPVRSTGNVNVKHAHFSNSKIWLDVHSTRLRILDYTFSYAATLGAGALGMNFLDWVVDEERFQTWIQSHNQIHLDTGTQLHRLNQIILRDPRTQRNLMITDCLMQTQTNCWPGSLETQSQISVCVDMRITGHVEDSLKQEVDKRIEKGSSTNISL